MQLSSNVKETPVTDVEKVDDDGIWNRTGFSLSIERRLLYITGSSVDKAQASGVSLLSDASSGPTS